MRGDEEGRDEGEGEGKTERSGCCAGRAEGTVIRTSPVGSVTPPVLLLVP